MPSQSIILIIFFMVLVFVFLICVSSGRKEHKQKHQSTAQEKLIEHYKKSPLTAEIVNYICCGNPTTQVPLEIHIYDTYIQAHKIGGVITYDFTKHNVEPLKSVITTYDHIDDLAHKEIPQLALAAAINSLLSYKYVVYDYAEKNRNDYTSRTGDHESYTSYRSSHVIMQLKNLSATSSRSTPTTPNRTF